ALMLGLDQVPSRTSVRASLNGRSCSEGVTPGTVWLQLEQESASVDAPPAPCWSRDENRGSRAGNASLKALGYTAWYDT
ncbi:hypothetical protein NDU88_007211, partial [Pleurodeles waltl]